ALTGEGVGVFIDGQAGFGGRGAVGGSVAQDHAVGLGGGDAVADDDGVVRVDGVGVAERRREIADQFGAAATTGNRLVRADDIVRADGDRVVTLDLAARAHGDVAAAGAAQRQAAVAGFDVGADGDAVARIRLCVG